MAGWRDILRKALTRVQHPTSSVILRADSSPTDSEMSDAVADGTGYDVLMTPLRWIQTAALEARPVVTSTDGDVIEGHRLSDLLRRPNDAYGGSYLIEAAIFDLLVHGNAYILVVRDRNGAPRQLWWAPAENITPRWPQDGSAFVSHYDYIIGLGVREQLDPEDVIHVRMGVDPVDIRRGLSPLRSLLIEVWGDREAARLAASLLRNGGVPGLVLSPTSGDYDMTPEAAEAAQRQLMQYASTGRGRPLVLTGPVRVEQFGFSPQQLDLSPLRNISEERVCAALGVPAAVVGFGAGLQQTKVGATMTELRRLAWHHGVAPVWRRILDAVEMSLGPSVLRDGERLELDTSGVMALREDQDDIAQRVQRLVAAGIMTRADARRALGLPTEDADEVFLLPATVIPLPRGEAGLPQEVAPPAAAKAMSQKDHNHSIIERLIADRRSVRPSRRIVKYMRRVDETRLRLSDKMARDLEDHYRGVATAVERVARDLFTEQAGKDAGGEIERKDAATDAAEALAEQLQARIAEIEAALSEGGRATDKIKALLSDPVVSNGMSALLAPDALQRIFGAHYEAVWRAMVENMQGSLGVAIESVDELAVRVVEIGRRRALLSHAGRDMQDRVFRALRDGIADGLAGEALAERVAGALSAGPWSSVEIRAMVVARTELAYATNMSTIVVASSSDSFESMYVMDARLGPTDTVCEELAGTVVTMDEATELTEQEHPNGTRHFVPLTPLLAEEMGITTGG